MFGRPRWALSKTHIVTASIIALAVFCTPTIVSAANLGAVASVTHGGKTVVDNESVFRSDFSSITNNWAFSFTWPSSVANNTAMLAVIRGTFGNIAGGTPQSGVNFDANFQAWAAGTNNITKSIGMPPLGGLTAQSGTYTILVAHTNGGFNQAGTMQWFASGGAAGQEPVNYRMMTFTYSATDVATELPGALSSIQYGPRAILPSTEVPQEEVTPNVPNPSQFWRFNFTWPNAVANQNALLMVFRGTYGALDGGAPVSGTNYAATVQAWAAGSNNLGKFMSLPGLEAEGAAGTYTVMIAERDPKFSANPLDQEALWFSSGGTQGVAPRKYSLLTFTLTDPPKCCSSVLFLPGFQASELYEDTGSGEAKRWLPGLFQSSVEALRMNTNGSPQQALHTKSDSAIKSVTFPIVGEVLVIYKTFFALLDSMQPQAFREWRAYPYDWRFNVEDIVENGTLQTGGTTKYLVEEVEDLAQDSYTERITIVGHSNGGLLAKALMRKLEALGKANLVDKVILVGSPQLGTPKAIASLLHGDDQEIPQGAGALMLSKANARMLAEYMPGAFGLLPSAEYYERVLDPVADLSTADTLRIETGISETIDTYTEAQQLMTGNGLRAKPNSSNVEDPNNLSEFLLAQAGATHMRLDAWTPPAGVEVIQIAGWGLDTVKGITYWDEAKIICVTIFSCGVSTSTRHKAEMTEDGDGTVVTASSVGMIDEHYFINLHDENKVNEQNNAHVNITESPAFKSLLQMLVTQSTSSLPSYITNTVPDTNTTDGRLRLRVLSPASILATDSLGRSVGLLANPVPGSDFLYKKEEVPNSYYEEFGDTKYLGLASGQYDFTMHGTDTGYFTLEIEEVSGDTTTSQTSLVDIPVTPETDITFSTNIVGQVGQVSIDKNGDGFVDFLVTPTSNGEVSLPKALITVTSESKSITMGSAIPSLSYTLTGFVADETLETSDITGTPECTTTATPASPAGMYPITCTAGTLKSDYYTFETFVAGALTITYAWSGFQQPIDDPVATPGISPSVFKAGSTVPVKFKLRNASGAIVEATVLPQWLTPTRGAPLSGSVDEPVYSDPATTGNTYRYDPTNKQYIYNWKTNKSDAGYWYRIYAKLDDGTIKSVMIGLR